MTSTHRPSQVLVMAQINALHASGWSFIKQAENSKSKVKISGLIIKYNMTVLSQLLHIQIEQEQ